MGQAKQRGTFEQRKVEGIERRLAREEQERIDRAARRAAFDAAAETRRQERAKQEPRRAAAAGQNSAFGRSRPMSRALMAAAAMVALAAPKGK